MKYPKQELTAKSLMRSFLTSLYKISENLEHQLKICGQLFYSSYFKKYLLFAYGKELQKGLIAPSQ